MRWLYKYITLQKTVAFLVVGLVFFALQSDNAKTSTPSNPIIKTANNVEYRGYNEVLFDRNLLGTNNMMAQVPSASAVESLLPHELTFGSHDETKAGLQKSLMGSRKFVLCSGLPQQSVSITKNITLLPMAGGTAIGAP